MDTTEIRSKIDDIIATFGMKADVASKAMHMSLQVYRNKRTKTHLNKFNQKNLDDLISYIKTEADKL